ncbi:hypothetical protein [Oceanirhabdus sp. W0125-5]|uniref:hypothetical protein n=1 Tax=Oceanirhabdus sp. W0125-5 TaxID=2999116 RepID=UPI0022F32D4D|nr:hypothetical protein [Oceanirhabdus sp. W0125-5]WBW98382.1 hypothetical protein OW730_06330 [Oceanirhabdus sp. W0125-5]
MSNNILKVIPKDYKFIPTLDDRHEIEEFLRINLLAHEVKIKVFKNVEFVDQGSNFESIVCPYCGFDISIDWWHEKMSAAYENLFEDLNVITPCCKNSSTLNDLKYILSAGFAKFMIEISNPKLKLNEELIDTIEQKLCCKIKEVWVHY